MDNVVPEAAATEGVDAGVYPAMVTELRRAPAGGKSLPTDQL